MKHIDRLAKCISAARDLAKELEKLPSVPAVLEARGCLGDSTTCLTQLEQLIRSVVEPNREAAEAAAEVVTAEELKK